METNPPKHLFSVSDSLSNSRTLKCEGLIMKANPPKNKSDSHNQLQKIREG